MESGCSESTFPIRNEQNKRMSRTRQFLDALQTDLVLEQKSHMMLGDILRMVHVSNQEVDMNGEINVAEVVDFLLKVRGVQQTSDDLVNHILAGRTLDNFLKEVDSPKRGEEQ